MILLKTHHFRQISRKALERNETHRAEYRVRMGDQYTPDQLVFVDESACDRRTYLRDRAWALEGLRACRKQVFARGKRYALSLLLGLLLTYSYRYSILPAISIDSILDCLIIEGAFNSALFMIFIESLVEKMLPFPNPRSVIVMDNCSIHKAPEIREISESRYVILFLS